MSARIPAGKRNSRTKLSALLPMNPDFPQTPREELEARLTALLLGELPAEEAAALRAQLAQDPELAALHKRLERTIGLVREVSVSQSEPATAQAAPLKFSEERREKLLAEFKTIKPQPLLSPLSRRHRWLVPVAAAAILLLLAAITLPNFIRARNTSASNAMMNQLRQIEAAKQQWAVDHNKPANAVPTTVDLKPYLKGGELPASIAGETYVLGPVGLPPTVETGEAQSRTWFFRRSAQSPQSQAITTVATADASKQDAREHTITTRLDLPRGGMAERYDHQGTARRPSAQIVLPTPAESEAEVTASAVRGASELGLQFGTWRGGGRPSSVAEGRKSGEAVVAQSVSDPEWAGVLKQPALPYSTDNKFVARYDYVQALGVSPTTGLPVEGIALALTPEGTSVDSFAGDALESKVAASPPAPAAARQQVVLPTAEQTGGKGTKLAAENDVTLPDWSVRTSLRGIYDDNKPDPARPELTGGFAVPGTLTVTPPPAGPPGRAGVVASPVPETTVDQMYRAPGYPASRRVPPVAVAPAEQDADKPIVLGDQPALGGAFASASPTPETRGRGFSLLGSAPQPEQPDAKAQDSLGFQVASALPIPRFKAGAFDSEATASSTTPQDLYSTEAAGRTVVPVESSIVALEAAKEPLRRSQSRIVLPPTSAGAGVMNAGVAIAGDPLQDARVLIEPGRPADAEAKLREVLQSEPDNRAAGYYLNLARKQQQAAAAKMGENESRKGVMQIALADKTTSVLQRDSEAKRELERMDRYWQIPPTNLVRTGGSRHIIASKLNGIRLESLNLNGVTLGEVVQMLNEEAKKQDPEKKGIHFILNPNLPAVQASPVDPTSGLPQAGSSTGTMDVGSLAVTSGSTLRDARLTDVLDAIIKSAEQPLKYSIEDYAVVLSLAERNDPPAPRKPVTNAPTPQPEIQTTENAFSTFSLNVSDVAFKLAAASLEQGQMPDPASVRAEEFINAFDYRDPEPPPGMPVAFAWERARYPFAHNRDLLRFSLKTGAAGRQAGRPLNVVLLLDNSGSMERADRVQIIREALRVLAGQLQPQDKLSIISFARTPRLWVDGVSGSAAGEIVEQISGLTPQGGTNLEEAMNLAYATALRHYLASGLNRVVLLTDGAANLGNVEPESLKHAVETHRKQGVALDCFGIGWEGLNDDLLEVLSRNGDGRYGFINSPTEAATEFAAQLAGALQVAASDVKVQVEFNPKRVTAYRQIGYAKHQLTKEQFRDNTVDAAEIAAQEAGNALYTVEVNPAGEGPLGIVRVRFKLPGTKDYREHEWPVPYTGSVVPLEHASPAMRLAASASAFAEWLVASPFAGEVTPDALLGYLSNVPEVYGADTRPKKLEWMIRQAKSVAGK
ncbi:MAG: von Willebrand factor type A domain-containing protein [Verrucomicrobia bacterium]|nr:von Willebrand factor type A domain-containing protein [Verrucomicrobiota bacterium]